MANIDIPFWIYSSLKSKKTYVQDNLILADIEECFENNLQITKEKYINYNGITEVIIYKLNNEIHRELDKPAIIWLDGHSEWFLNGKRNRNNDLPSVISKSLGKIWFIDNEINRLNLQPSFITKLNNLFYITNNKVIPIEEIKRQQTKKKLNSF
jgi:hypothetical protein